ncbi:hypothetical protein Gotur_008212 [Gossypium turneri]
MEQLLSILHGLKPAMLMVVVQVVFAGVNVLYKLAENDGMSSKVMVAYRFIFASAVMIPLALIVERKRPKLTWTVLLQAFFCGLLGLEKVGFGTMAGKAKVLGTLIGIGGAMLLTFYKGVQINTGSVHLDLVHHQHHGAASSYSSHPSSAHHLWGALLALGSCISYALWLNVQAKMGEKYPCYYSSTALTCIMAAIQSTVFALCLEKDWSQWKLGWNVRLLTVAFAGILGSGLMFSLVAWCVRLKGPLYASVFNPLLLVLVAFAGSFFLEENLYLGSIMGAVLIVMGLYIVLWGKGKEMEMKKMNELVSSIKSVTNNRAIQVIVTSNDATSTVSNNDNNSINVASKIPSNK